MAQSGKKRALRGFLAGGDAAASQGFKRQRMSRSHLQPDNLRLELLVLLVEDLDVGLTVHCWEKKGKPRSL